MRAKKPGTGCAPVSGDRMGRCSLASTIACVQTAKQRQIPPKKTHQMADGGEFAPPATGCHGAHICTARSRPATRGNAGPALCGGI
ncbi:hypothetical protein CLJ1_0706 [Pseudomonas paraeruginosa]|nr:putative iron-sulfur protein [Pseudomonas paraeruginosa]PTC38734.1 hypothetical protein CLJ1_0706 [Pseudomonas aeruginosa]